jgi:hypothetical protein
MAPVGPPSRLCRRPVSLLMPPTWSTDCALGDVAEKRKVKV